MTTEMRPVPNRDPVLVKVFREIAELIYRPVADVRLSAEATTTSPRTVTAQVIDRRGANKPGRWWVRLMFGTAEWDSTTGQTVTIVSAAVSLVLSADRVYDVLTDADGSIKLTIAGAADDYYVTGSVLGPAASSGAVGVT